MEHLVTFGWYDSERDDLVGSALLGKVGRIDIDQVVLENDRTQCIVIGWFELRECVQWMPVTFAIAMIGPDTHHAIGIHQEGILWFVIDTARIEIEAKDEAARSGGCHVLRWLHFARAIGAIARATAERKNNE